MNRANATSVLHLFDAAQQAQDNDEKMTVRYQWSRGKEQVVLQISGDAHTFFVLHDPVKDEWTFEGPKRNGDSVKAEVRAEAEGAFFVCAHRIISLLDADVFGGDLEKALKSLTQYVSDYYSSVVAAA